MTSAELLVELYLNIICYNQVWKDRANPSKQATCLISLLIKTNLNHLIIYYVSTKDFQKQVSQPSGALIGKAPQI